MHPIVNKTSVEKGGRKQDSSLHLLKNQVWRLHRQHNAKHNETGRGGEKETEKERERERGSEREAEEGRDRHQILNWKTHSIPWRTRFRG